MSQELEEDIRDIESALNQLQGHGAKGTRDWDNCVRWLTELLEIKRKQPEDTECKK
jgi:hypothetical protein